MTLPADRRPTATPGAAHRVDDGRANDGRANDGRVDDGRVDDGRVDDGRVDDAATGDRDLDEALDDDLFDADWNRPKRTNRLTRVLLAGIVAALAFGGGVAVQKRHDTGLVPAPPPGTQARGPGVAQTGPPATSGTVTSTTGNALTIDAAGKVVTVTVPPTAAVTTIGLGAIAVGDTVAVSGTTADDGSIIATSVTSRRRGG